MMLYIAIFAALLPALLLVLYIRRRDKYRPEPWSEVLKACGWGALSAGLALVIEVVLQQTGVVDMNENSVAGSIWNAFVGAALPEESAKLLMLWLCLRSNKYFDEYMDGIVYAVAVGMGFAGVENIIYLFDNLGSWQSVMVARSLTAVPGHYMFAVAMGFFYSLTAFRNARYAPYILLIPVLLHGVYDSLLFLVRVEGTPAWLLLMAFLGFLIHILIRAGEAINKHLMNDLEQGA